jgi:anaerobic selenocysteine-containing dehydrogenase
MSEKTRITRKQAMAGALTGAGAIALGAASEAQALDESTALFLGQDLLPVPPKNAKVHTSACQYCNVGCGYKIYTWPVSDTPQSPNADGPYPKGRSRTGSRQRWSRAAASAARTATSPWSPTRIAWSTAATTRREAGRTR